MVSPYSRVRPRNLLSHIGPSVAPILVSVQCVTLKPIVKDLHRRLTSELPVVHLALISPVLQGSMLVSAATSHPPLPMQTLPCKHSLLELTRTEVFWRQINVAAQLPEKSVS